MDPTDTDTDTGIDTEHHLCESSIRPLDFRYVLVWYLQQHDTLTISEIHELLRRDGIRVGGRPSKTISDALRWEVRRGRAVRLSRGRYGRGRLRGGTAHRIRQRVQALAADRPSCRSDVGIPSTARTDPTERDERPSRPVRL